MDTKLIRNLCNACHAICVVIAYITSLPSNQLFYGSIMYFMCDTYYEILCMRKRQFNVKIYELGMIIHHLVSMLSMLYLLNPGPTADMVYYFYYILEFSNIPMYLVYHLKQIKYSNKSLLKMLLVGETFWYIYFRLYLGGSRIYEYLCNDGESLIIKCYMITLWVLSVIWSIKLSVQLKF